MDTFLWALLVTDIFILVVLANLLYLRQRAYSILALISFIILFAINVIMLLAPHNPAIVWFPGVLFVALILGARSFLPRPQKFLSIKWARFLVLLLVLIILVSFVSLVLLQHKS